MIDKKLSKVFVGMICVVGLFLTHCHQEPAPTVEMSATTSTQAEVLATPAGTQPTATVGEIQPTTEGAETATSTQTPTPTATPAEVVSINEVATGTKTPQPITETPPPSATYSLTADPVHATTVSQNATTSAVEANKLRVYTLNGGVLTIEEPLPGMQTDLPYIFTHDFEPGEVMAEALPSTTGDQNQLGHRIEEITLPHPVNVMMDENTVIQTDKVWRVTLISEEPFPTLSGIYFIWLDDTPHRAQQSPWIPEQSLYELFIHTFDQSSLHENATIGISYDNYLTPEPRFSVVIKEIEWEESN